MAQTYALNARARRSVAGHQVSGLRRCSTDRVVIGIEDVQSRRLVSFVQGPSRIGPQEISFDNVVPNVWENRRAKDRNAASARNASPAVVDQGHFVYHQPTDNRITRLQRNAVFAGRKQVALDLNYRRSAIPRLRRSVDRYGIGHLRQCRERVNRLQPAAADVKRNHRRPAVDIRQDHRSPERARVSSIASAGAVVGGSVYHKRTRGRGNQDRRDRGTLPQNNKIAQSVGVQTHRQNRQRRCFRVERNQFGSCYLVLVFDLRNDLNLSSARIGKHQVVFIRIGNPRGDESVSAGSLRRNCKTRIGHKGRDTKCRKRYWTR